MSRVVDIRKSDDPQDVIHQVVQELSEGRLVALPTETVYLTGAHALKPEGIERLSRLFGRPNSTHPFTLLLKGAQEAMDYVPGMSPTGQKLARRCWPGPVILAFDVDGVGGLLGALPAETRRLLAPNNVLYLRVPAHQVTLAALRWMPAPMVASPEAVANHGPATTAAQIVNELGDELAVIVDDGTCRYSEVSTVVRVTANSWQLESPGVVTETMISRLAGDVYLFVCTGNTCRSPMAEGLFRKLLSEKLKCTEDELLDRGYLVASAGLSAAVGSPASPEGIELLSRRGIDLSGHASQPLSDRLLDQADRVYTMTRAHRQAILAARPDVADRVELLARDGTDVSDPIGRGAEDYENCEREIERHIRAILKELPVS